MHISFTMKASLSLTKKCKVNTCIYVKESKWSCNTHHILIWGRSLAGHNTKYRNFVNYHVFIHMYMWKVWIFTEAKKCFNSQNVLWKPHVKNKPLLLSTNISKMYIFFFPVGEKCQKGLCIFWFCVRMTNSWFEIQ